MRIRHDVMWAAIIALTTTLSAQDLATWNHHRTIQLNTSPSGADVKGDVQNFPLAIALDATSFDFAQAKQDGSDIRFSVENNGPALLHAIEHWDATNKTAMVWVKVPLIKGNNASQSIVMHWGKSDALKTSDSAKVFDTADGWVGVWHLDEEGNSEVDGYQDATGNMAHATGVNLKPGSRVGARAGKGVKLKYADVQWIKVDSDKRKLFDLTKQLTFSIWVWADSFGNKGNPADSRQLPGYETMFAKGDNSWRLQKFGVRDWHKPPADLVEICIEKAPKADWCCIGRTDMKTGQWYHFVGVHDYPKVRLYVNGVLEKDETWEVEWVSGDHPVGIGNQSQFPQRGRRWDGVLDEARVMSVPRDEHWIKLDYESQREGQKLYTFGAGQ